uniref:Cytochrome P450 family 8 subfamily B member 1 n=1 Tax=Scleropages formosus TaxID=113540 RepID=A0A8C9U9C6_SCLFO
MHVLLPVLLAILACLLGGLYLLGAFRRRRPGEPPLDKGPMPWLGHVLEFRRDTSKFLQRMKKKHGDIFTVQLGGFYFTFIMDPLSFGAVVKESRGKLDFFKFAEQLVARVFGYMAMENEHKHMQLSSNKHLMGDGLVVMTQAMMGNLQNLMLYSLGQGDNQKTWKEEALFNYCYNILFRAGYLTLFGNEVACSSKSPEKAEELDRVTSNELFYKFQKYDKLFPDLAYGVLPPREKMEAERLKRLFWDKFSVENVNKRENVSGWILEHQQFREENGVEKSMQDRFMFLLLWPLIPYGATGNRSLPGNTGCKAGGGGDTPRTGRQSVARYPKRNSNPRPTRQQDCGPTHCATAPPLKKTFEGKCTENN